MAYTKYSLTPSSNTAAPPDGAPEGMLPSAVNDTMRDMMAQIRDCGDGIRDGTYTMTAPKITGGTITGSTINNSAIGGTTATTGKFTTLEATGVATFSAGAVGTPAITTTGDTNTGIFFPAADTIAFTEGGAESMRIDSGGRLIVGGTSAVQGARIESVGNTSGDALALRGRSADDLSNLVFIANAAITEYARISGINTSSLTFGTGSGGVERMRIDSSGNVGIGTTSPSYKLHVVGSGTGASARIESTSTANAQLSFVNTTATGGFVVGLLNNTSGDALIYHQDAKPIGFYTNGLERMRITSAGDLLIGTTNADARLTVATGNDEAVYALNTAGASSATMLAWNNAGSGNNYFHAFFVNASPVNVGNIDYNRAGALVRYNTTSDATLKNIFGDSDGQKSIGILKSTRIREYAWKDDAEQKPQIGVIAQELYETYKGAVSVGGENDKGDYRPWGVDKTAFTFHLIAGWQNHEKLIQEQQALIENLTTRLNALEGN